MGNFCVHLRGPGTTDVRHLGAEVEETAEGGLEDVVDLGLSLAVLKDFSATHLEEVVRLQLHTGEVNKLLVLPKTHGTKFLSYAEILLREGVVDSMGIKAVGKATIFVAQSWDNPFCDLVDSLDCWIQECGENPDTTYFWLDLFSVKPGRGGWRMPETWWSERYLKTIGSIGNTLVVAEPWHSPLTFVGPWCVWQLYSTCVTGARLHLTMSSAQRNLFVTGLTCSFENVRSALSSIRAGFTSESSQQYVQGEHHHITDEIQRVVSFERLNEMLQTRLRQWLMQVAKDELANAMSAKARKPEDSQAWRRVTANELSLRDHVGQLLRELGSLETAEDYFRSLRSDCDLRLGADNILSQQVCNHLAVTLRMQLDPLKNAEAEALHRDLLQRCKMLRGEQGLVHLQTASNLGETLLKKWRSGVHDVGDEARELCIFALEGRDKTLGAQHPRTLYTATTLAQLLSSMIPVGRAQDSEIRQAETLHERAVTGLSEKLGSSHPLTLRAAQFRAEHRLHIAQRDHNKELCTKVYEELTDILARQTVALGREHSATSYTRELVNKTFLSLNSRNEMQDDPSLTSVTALNLAIDLDSESRPWREFQPEHFADLNNTTQFARVRQLLRLYGVGKLKQQLTQLGFVGVDGKLTTTTKPFNIFARIGSGVMPQDSMLQAQQLLGDYQEEFLVACNRPECDENWESSDPAWLGKASMSKHHRFLITKNLDWQWFNVLVFGIASPLEEAVGVVERIQNAAQKYVKAAGWPENVAFVFHVYALSTVNSLHLHMIDMDNVGPTYYKMEHKNLPLRDVLSVLRDELKQKRDA